MKRKVRIYASEAGLLLAQLAMVTKTPDLKSKFPVSTKWRAHDLFESLTFTSRYMYRLVAEIHQTDDFEQRLENPRPYPQHNGMDQKNES